MNAGQSLSPAAGPGRNAQNPGDGGCCVRDQKAVTIHAEAVTPEEVLRDAWFDLKAWGAPCCDGNELSDSARQAAFPGLDAKLVLQQGLEARQLV
jgi:hypothetical protein